jgi:hydroxyacylglutathione hydrolase
MALRVHQIGALNDNYIHLVVCQDTGHAAIVDPSEGPPALKLLRAHPEAELRQIWCTHHHWDHIGGIDPLLEAHPGTEVFASHYDVEGSRVPQATRGLDDGASFALGTSRIEIDAIPGHTLGHIAFRAAADRIAFVGDTLFAAGCGRLFEGDAEQMTRSLYEVIGAWPEDTLLFCGHEYTEANLRFAVTVEPHNVHIEERVARVAEQRARRLSTVPSTLAEERQTNPFLRCDEPSVAAHLDMPESSRAQRFGELRARKDRF